MRRLSELPGPASHAAPVPAHASGLCVAGEEAKLEAHLPEYVVCTIA